MAHKHTRSRPHAELRHRSQSPMPAVEEVEQQLVALLSPSLLAPRQMALYQQSCHQGQSSQDLSLMGLSLPSNGRQSVD